MTFNRAYFKQQFLGFTFTRNCAILNTTKGYITEIGKIAIIKSYSIDFIKLTFVSIYSKIRFVSITVSQMESNINKAVRCLSYCLKIQFGLLFCYRYARNTADKYIIYLRGVRTQQRLAGETRNDWKATICPRSRKMPRNCSKMGKFAQIVALKNRNFYFFANF